MDCFARGLRNAAKIVEDGLFERHVKVCFLLLILTKQMLIFS